MADGGAHALDSDALGCGYCNRTARPLTLDDAGDLVCPDGYGCAVARAPKRHASVERSTVRGPRPAPKRSPDVCACGGGAQWQELRDGRLVGCCEGCEPGGPCR